LNNWKTNDPKIGHCFDWCWCLAWNYCFVTLFYDEGKNMIDTRLLEQGSEEWKLARLGHVSASNIAAVMSKTKEGKESATRKAYKIRLVAERMTGHPQEQYKNAAMEWGNEQEPFARMAYESVQGLLVDKTGFWKHLFKQWIGVSPDGLVGSDGLIEIKCPNTTTHLEYIFDDVVPSEYIKQIQCQLWVTNRAWCDFVSYDPRLPPKNQLFIKRLHRDNQLIAVMQEEVDKFLNEVQIIIDKLKGM
jgi:putative phage-type endonuclease